MRNRPGRIFYMLEFRGLDADFVDEYCTENLHNQENKEGVIRLASLFDEFNFDMLKAMVEEMNRYGETAQEVMSLLNTKPEYSESVDYDVTATMSGVPIDNDEWSDSSWCGNPMTKPMRFSYYEKDGGDDEEDSGSWKDIRLTSKQLRSADGRNGKFVFQDGQLTVVLTRKKAHQFDYSLVV